MSNEETNGRIRTYKVHHESPFEVEHQTALRYILLPYGNSYGDVPRNAGHGDRIRFLNGDEAEIISVAVCDIQTKLVNLLANMRYDADFSLIRRAWLKRAEMIGASHKAISETECLFLWHSKKI